MLSVEFLEKRVEALRQASATTTAHAGQVQGALSEATFLLDEARKDEPVGETKTDKARDAGEKK